MNESKQKSFTLCLNMIVKNESHIIIQTLTDLCKKIKFDYWIISDTGSSDNTIELIQRFFRDIKIQGELIRTGWIDFGYNRTIALEAAFDKTDYILVFDADDSISGNFILPDNIFEYDSWYVRLVSSDVHYYRKMIFSNRKKYKFVGVLHEYLECITNETSSYITGNYHVVSGKFGNRSNCNDKYLKDAILLENAYAEARKRADDIHMRYSFYCANSYRDANETDKAIEWYKNTLTLNNWTQEKYISCLRLYELYESKNIPENGLHYLIESQMYDYDRVECIYRLIKYYTQKSQYAVAFSFYTLIQHKYNNQTDYVFTDKLFVNYIDYALLLPYYMIIVCERLNNYKIGLRMFEIIFDQKILNVEDFWIQNLIYNFQFFIEKNKSVSLLRKYREYIGHVIGKKISIDTNLVNKNETFIVSSYVDILNPCASMINTDADQYIVIAILAKDKACFLPFYLECIYNQTYNKKFIHLYIRTNDNTDNTSIILKDFILKYGDKYASVYFNEESVSEKLKTYRQHEWTALRFSLLGAIRQASIEHAIYLKSHYFVADCDNFIIPSTINNLFHNRSNGVISPMLSYDGYDTEKCNYSNFHYVVCENGYYLDHDTYYALLKRNIVGLARVCCVHCTYFVANNFLKSVKYDDQSGRHEYVIFSESLRRNNIPQFLDNTQKYGYLTFCEDNQFKKIYVTNHSKYSF